jgi:hypothetical protein
MNQYKLFLDSSKYLYDENGILLVTDHATEIKYHDIKCNIAVSPTIKIDSLFKKGDSMSIECKGPKKTYGQHIITFDNDTQSSWFQELDGYYYLMFEMCDYTFNQYGESPFAILKGIKSNDGVIIEDLVIYDLSEFLCLCHYQDDWKKYNFRNNESYNGYYNYTKYFNTSSKSKL